MSATNLDKLSTGETPYHLARSLRVDDGFFGLGINRHTIRQVTNRDKVWNRYAGCLVTRGSGTYRDWQGRVHEVAPGSFVHHFPGRYHHIERHCPWEEHGLMLDEALYGRLRGLGVVDEVVGVVATGVESDLPARFSRLRARLEAACDPGSLIVEAAALLQRVRELTNQPADSGAGVSPIIAQARGRLAADLRAELSLHRLAADCGLSYAGFRRRFRLEVGVAPAAYRNAQRLEHARQILTHQQMRIAEVATTIGFRDPFLFSRCFRQRFGQSPRLYHRTHYAE